MCVTNCLISFFLIGIFSVNNVADCPGTCIHAITSLFCDEILENVSCAPLFRCCIVLNNVTLVETSPPLDEITTTLTPLNESVDKHSSLSTVHSFEHSTTTSLPNVSKISSSTNNLFSSTTPVSSFTTITPKCSGICMENKLSKYCGNILASDDVCDLNQFCCLQSNRTIITTTTAVNQPASEIVTDSIDLNSSSSSTIIDTTTITSTTSGSETSSTSNVNNKKQTQNSSEKKIVLEEDSVKETVKNTTETPALENENKHNKNSDESSSTQNANDLPACDNCVTLIFSLLCDEIDNTRYCPNDGKCCVYDVNDETKNQSPANTQLTASNQIGKCPGTCIPTILSGICSKPSEIIFKTTTCITGMFCCYTPMTESQEQYNSSMNEKPSLLDSSDGLTFIEPSEETLNTKLTQFKPPPPTTGNGYYQLVPRPHQLIPNQFTTNLQSTSPPTNALSSPNWPFLNGNNNNHPLQKIPIYKPLLSNSQMIPNSYLSNNGLTTALTNSLNNGRPNYILNNLNNFNNLNNRSPALYYPTSSSASGPPSTSELFSNLNAHLANSHLSNNVLPTIPTTFKLNSTSSLINHLLLTNSIPPTTCTGTCIPHIFKFTCFGANTIYTNFICNKPQQLCCASIQDIETYESTVLGGLSNETNLITSLMHNNNYFANLLPNLPVNLPSSMPGNLPINNKPTVTANNAITTMKNGNAINQLKVKHSNKNTSPNYNLNNKMQPVDRVPTNDNPLTDKFIEINQPAITAASNVNRNRYHPTTAINKNTQKLSSTNNKWSVSSLSSSHFTPSERPLNQKPTNVDRIKKPDASIPFSPLLPEHHRPVEVPRLEVPSTSNKCK